MFTSAVRPYSSDTHYRKATGDALVDCATDRPACCCPVLNLRYRVFFGV